MTKEQENNLAISNGFTPIPDDGRGWGWCKFEKGNIHVWMCRKGWARAALINNHYTGHVYGTLEEMLSL